MEEREQLEKAITRLEAQRENLGDAAVDAALVGLRQRLAMLDRSGGQDPTAVQNTGHIGERRVVTVLFCDVANSTSLAEGIDPEVWTGIMNAAFELITEPVERFDGTVARLMGDAILAFFGAPTAREDDPQRAVLAGLAILENISPFRRKLGKERDLDFSVRVGINTGLAIVGDVGSHTAVEYTAMGDAVNVAARMEQTAQPGTVQITQDTFALVAPLFEFEVLDDIFVKGKNKPITAYRVTGRKVEPGRLRGLTSQGIYSPLVGRELELAAAQGALTRLLDSKGGILTIFGEAGIGKSRLLLELRENSTDLSISPLTWLVGNALSFGQSISYLPFQEILRGYAGINEEDTETQAWRKLELPVRELFPETADEILPYLASLLAIEVQGDYAARVKYLDGEALGYQVYRASRLFFHQLAEWQPLVLVFEDLHWLDKASSDLLEHLLPLTRSVPLLICGLSRPDSDSPVDHLRTVASDSYSDRYTEIVLTPLSESDSGLLVHNLLEIDDLPAHVRQMMVAKADGNPFFLEEIVRDLIETGAILKDTSTGRWRATAAAEKVTVPGTIQGLINARIDRLDETLKRVIRRAAVIGRTFLFRVLNAILEDDHNLEEQLDQLQHAELIRVNQLLPELEYIFKHALVQEVAYESILMGERRQLHARVGAAIETLMADRMDEFYALLAYHYSAAEQWEQAQEYLFKAGDQAGNMAADAEALTHYQQAIEAYARVRGDAWDPVDRARLERKIGEALFRLGEHSQARTYLDRSLAYLGVSIPSSHWGVRLAILRALLIQTGHRLLPRLFVPSMSDAPEALVEESYYASRALGWVELTANPERYLLIAVKALNASEQGGFAYGSADLAATLGLAASLIGWPVMAEQYFRQSSHYAVQINHDRPVYQLELGLATHFNILGDMDKMREHGQRGAEMALKAGDLRAWSLGMANVAFSQAAVGNLYEGTEVCQEMLRIAEESSDQQIACIGLFAYGVFLLQTGQLDEAISSFQQSIEISIDLPDYISQVGASGQLGRAYLAKGEVARAIEILEATEELFSTRGGNVSGYPFFGVGLAEAYLTRAEESDGLAKQVWLKKAKSVCRKTLKEARRTPETLPAAMMFKGRYEWLSGKPDAAQRWWVDALVQAEESGTRYSEGLIHLEIGSRLGDREHLQQAEFILNSIGAQLDLATAREAMANLPAS